MTGPFIVMSRSRVKPGRAEDYAAFCERLIADIEEDEPRLLAFNQYESDDRTSSVVIQVHPDAESFEYHLKLFGERVGKAFDYVDVLGVELYGPPSPALQDWTAHGMSDLPVTVHPLRTFGFTRLTGG